MYDIIIYFFEPTSKNEENKACELCHAIYPLFEEKLGSNDRFIRFSHKNLRLLDIKEFINKLLSQMQIKKIYILTLESDSFTAKTKLNIPKILEQITSNKVKKFEFSDLITNEKLKFSIFYEIVKDRYV